MCLNAILKLHYLTVTNSTYYHSRDRVSFKARVLVDTCLEKLSGGGINLIFLYN